jgi:hypothetical protein
MTHVRETANPSTVPWGDLAGMCKPVTNDTMVGMESSKVALPQNSSQLLELIGFEGLGPEVSAKSGL